MKRVILATLCLALAACADQSNLSRSEQTRKMAREAFGPVNTRGIDAEGDGVGLSMFRVFSEKPMPNRFEQRAPERFDNALVLDVAVDVKIEDRFPLYRIGLEPHKIPDRHRENWPSHVRIDPVRANGAPLVARMPESREPDTEGMIWTRWTYCADCFGLADIEIATPGSREQAFAAMTEAMERAGTKNGDPAIYAGAVRFLDLPGHGSLAGDAAVEMARIASEIIRKTEARLEEMAPAREDYDHLVEAFETSSGPVKELLRLCGTYAPNLETRDPDVEAERIAAYRQCGREAIRGFDREARREYLAGFAAEEARLARKAGLDVGDRVIVPGVGEELDMAREVLAEAEALYKERETRSAFPSAPRSDDQELLKADQSETALVTPDPEVAQLEEEAPAILPEPAAEPKVAEAPQPPHRRMHFVARLLPNGANLDLGDGGESCIGGLECEIGSVVPLIGAVEYCSRPGEMTETTAGWGLVVQRYLPRTLAEEPTISVGDGDSQVHEVAAEDKAALEAGLEAMRELKTPEGVRAFFTSYQAFYMVNTEDRECRDQWRDAGHAKVADNPNSVIRIPSEEDAAS